MAPGWGGRLFLDDRREGRLPRGVSRPRRGAWEAIRGGGHVVGNQSRARSGSWCARDRAGAPVFRDPRRRGRDQEWSRLARRGPSGRARDLRGLPQGRVGGPLVRGWLLWVPDLARVGGGKSVPAPASFGGRQRSRHGDVVHPLVLGGAMRFQAVWWDVPLVGVVVGKVADGLRQSRESGRRFRPPHGEHQGGSPPGAPRLRSLVETPPAWGRPWP